MAKVRRVSDCAPSLVGTRLRLWLRSSLWQARATIVPPVRFAAVLVVAFGALASCDSPPETGSLGAQFARDNDSRSLEVRSVREGYPASEAGMEPGDEIVMIDGIYVRGMTADEVKAKIHGAAGTSIALTVSRGERILHLDVKRSSGPVPIHSASPKQELLTE